MTGGTVVDGGRGVVLGELDASLFDDDRDMGVVRCGVAEAAQQVELPRRVVEQVGTPDHGVDAHRVVVDHHGELVGGEAVSPPYDEVARCRREVAVVVALDAVFERNGRGGDADAYGVAMPRQA